MIGALLLCIYQCLRICVVIVNCVVIVPIVIVKIFKKKKIGNVALTTN